ncbi:MAG: tetratricopeptide repeat protein [Ignavibacteriae bacterium]|nr:tetratricopeptide repeat protein [Ignavibacteriota bacterium]
MKKETIYVLVMLFISQVSFGQNIRTINLPIPVYSDSFLDIKVSNNSLCFLLIEDDSLNKSRLFKSSDNFVTYSEIKILYGKENIFHRLFIKDNIIALIHEYGVGDVYLWSFDGGISWKMAEGLAEYMFPEKFSNEIKKIDFEDNNYDDYIIYKSKDYGRNWDSQFFFNFNNILKIKKKDEFASNDCRIYFLDSYNGFCYGRLNVEEARGRFKSSNYSNVFWFKTKDGGESWERANGLKEYQDIYEPQFLDQSNGYVYCTKIINGEEFKGYLLKTTNGGSGWIPIKELNNNFNVKFKFINKDVGLIWLNENLLFRTLDGGKSYESIDLIIGDYIRSVEVQSNGNCYILTDNLYSFNIYDNNIINSDREKNYVKDQEDLKIKKEIEKISDNADEYYESKSFDKALLEYLKLEKDYNVIDLKITFRTAYCYDKIGNVEEALHYYLECIRINPSSSIAYNNIGVIYDKQKNYEKANEYYEKAYEIEPKELYKTNLERLKTLSYKLSDDDLRIINKYFPSHKIGSKLLYWQVNNSASYLEDVFGEDDGNNYAKVLINYYINYSAYQVNQVYLKESGTYLLDNNKLIYKGYNKMIGEYSYTKIAFPLDGLTKWIVYGFQLRFLGYEERVITSAGTFYNCLVIGKDYYKEYYAPDIGLVLVRSAITQSNFETEKELMSYTIAR